MATKKESVVKHYSKNWNYAQTCTNSCKKGLCQLGTQRRTRLHDVYEKLTGVAHGHAKWLPAARHLLRYVLQLPVATSAAAAAGAACRPCGCRRAALLGATRSWPSRARLTGSPCNKHALKTQGHTPVNLQCIFFNGKFFNASRIQKFKLNILDNGFFFNFNNIKAQQRKFFLMSIDTPWKIHFWKL